MKFVVSSVPLKIMLILGYIGDRKNKICILHERLEHETVKT